MKYRISSSVLQFKPKIELAWRLKEWDGIDDPDKDLLFFGLYHDRDFDVFYNFEGNRHVFWCGSDILNVQKDYERQRVLKLRPETKHYCENEQEAENLRSIGIEPTVIPSFLGRVSHYKLSCRMPKKGEKWKVWMCGHPSREQEYGFDQTKEMAKIFPDIEFHFYGVEKKYQGKPYSSSDDLPNVFYHGLVKEEDLDWAIKNYHCGFRANVNDGFSEVIVKSLLLGQYCITRIPYKYTWNYETRESLIQLFNKLKNQKKPNYEPRAQLIKEINQFPWCKREYWNPKDESSDSGIGNGGGSTGESN